MTAMTWGVEWRQPARFERRAWPALPSTPQECWVAAGSACAEAGVEVRPAWRQDDAIIAEAAKALWSRMGVAAGFDPEQRVHDLVVAGFAEGQPVILSSADIIDLETVQCRVARLRFLVVESHRNARVVLGVVRAAHALLEAWSAANPAEGVMGMAVGVRPDGVLANGGRPFLPMRPDDGLFGGMMLVSRTEAGEQLRMSWFRHAQF